MKQPRQVNLNESKCDDEGEDEQNEWHRLDHRPTQHHGRDRSWSLHLDNIVDALADEISGADAMIACVAWLTHPELLRAASRVPASFLVQKEDFLRPDSKRMSQGDLRGLYQTGPMLLRHEMGLVGGLSTHSYHEIDRVRCVGMTAKKAVVIPRMHHKFAVFGSLGEKGSDPDFGRFTPRAVAAGSFNWTHNATSSLENVMIIRNTEIARLYAREWAHVLTLSEPCDWESPYVAPEWRIGS